MYFRGPLGLFCCHGDCGILVLNFSGESFHFGNQLLPQGTLSPSPLLVKPLSALLLPPLLS